MTDNTTTPRESAIDYVSDLPLGDLLQFMRQVTRARDAKLAAAALRNTEELRRKIKNEGIGVVAGDLRLSKRSLYQKLSRIEKQRKNHCAERRLGKP